MLVTVTYSIIISLILTLYNSKFGVSLGPLGCLYNEDPPTGFLKETFECFKFTGIFT